MPQDYDGSSAAEAMAKGRSANDQRSDAKNPNNPASKSAADNRSNQINPNNPASKSKK